jgi:AbiV family abortive infection protein
VTSNKDKSHEFTKEQLRNTIGKCIENVQGLLKSAERLYEDKSTVQYALGLYMYAVEEYGKAHLLKSYLTENENRVLVPSWIFGRNPSIKSHNRKLDEGFKNLPPDCKNLTNSLGFHVNTSLTPRNDIVETPTGSTSITVPAHSSGISIYRTHPTRELTPYYKTGCFYIDWDENKKEPNFLYPAEKGQLLNNIRMMKDKVTSHQLLSSNYFT